MAAGQHGQLPLVPVGERDDDAIGRQLLQPGERVRGEARPGLLAVGDDRRSGLLKALDGVAHGLVLDGGKLRIANLAAFTAAIALSSSGGRGMLPIGSVGIATFQA